MVGINPIDGVPEPVKVTQSGAPRARSEAQPATVRDSLELSDSAQAASRTARLLAQARTADEMRDERVAKAKESIEKGLHRVQGVVRVVAARMSRYITANAYPLR